MRESFARRAALGTGLLVVGAVTLFAIVQKRDAAGREPRDRPTVASTSVGDPAPDTVRDAPARAVVPPPVQPAGVEPPPDVGERVYEEQRCAACHSIAGVGSPRSPLDGVGSRLSASEIRLWIVDPQAMRPGIRKPAFNDLPPEEMEALVAFLQRLR